MLCDSCYFVSQYILVNIFIVIHIFLPLPRLARILICIDMILYEFLVITLIILLLLHLIIYINCLASVLIVIHVNLLQFWRTLKLIFICLDASHAFLELLGNRNDPQCMLYCDNCWFITFSTIMPMVNEMSPFLKNKLKSLDLCAFISKKDLIYVL